MQLAKDLPALRGVKTMKNLLCVVSIAAALLSVAASAQSAEAPLTREQVRAELAQLESVGYRPSRHDADYPQALQAAESKVAALDAQRAADGGVNWGTIAGGGAHTDTLMNGRSR